MTMVAPTSAEAPYDMLSERRPMRCRKYTDGRVCNRTIRMIDWARPDIYDERCPKCGAFNVLVISPTVAAAEGV